MSEATQPTSHPFQAEVAAVLKLVTNSLYTNREIFLRELISNASDALDKARFSALVDSTLQGQELPQKIEVLVDKARGLLVIEDTGIGMTEQEAQQNLGTIAHSGTLKFIEQAAAKADGGRPDLNLIGQFGVGFYSAFMVADRIDVYSRAGKAGAAGIHWSSTGDGGYTLQASDRANRGTRIELTLRDDAKEFLDPFRLEHIIKRYSDYVLYPIELGEIQAEQPETPRQVNRAKAFWTQNPKDLSEDDYQEFYKHVMGGFVLPADKPLIRLHLSMDAPIQFKSVLFVPGRRPLDLFQEDAKHLQLYARRVLIMENCDKLLPPFLRFFRGVVDSEDLALNVSREMLQENQNVSAIRRQLTRKALSQLAECAKDTPEEYAKLWNEFGVFLKEGLHTDSAHREQLTELLRFNSTADVDKLVSLREVVDAMPADQDAIYYITGHKAEDLARSPHIEACKSRGWSVLLLTDAVDEWVVQELTEYAGKPLRSVTKGEITAPTDTDTTAQSGSLAQLITRAKVVLGDRVKDVRASNRLRQSASCLVDDDAAMGRNMERILRMAGRDVPSKPRILELNPEHKFVQTAQTIAAEHPDDGRLALWIELLLDQANLAEGSVPDPAGTVERVQRVLDSVAGLVTPKVDPS